MSRGRREKGEETHRQVKGPRDWTREETDTEEE